MKLKRLFTSLLFTFVFYLLSSQSPQGFNYQAIARDGSGNPIVNTSLQVKLAVMADSLGSTVYWEELFNPVTTNAFGLFAIVLGQGIRQATSAVSTFSNVNWNSWPLFVRTQIYYQNAWKNMGSARLWSVPYSLVSNKANTANGLAGTIPQLSVAGNTTTMDSALFVVRNNTGQIVFAVYNEGVRIYVDNGVAKGATKGGFAIGGFGTAKGTSQEYFRVTRDSTRVYVNQLAKGATKGGFAIGGFSPAKGADTTGYLNLTPQNYFIGYGAGNSANPGLYNSFMGFHAGINNTGSYNSFIGYKAGNTNTTGSQNIFLGYQAGFSNDTASRNIFIGNLSGYSNTWGNYNAFIGYQSGQMNTTGSANIYIGQLAGSKIPSGASNIFLGTYSGQNKTAGSRNIFIGSASGINSTTGNDNVFIGTATGYKTTSDLNIFIGNYSGFNNTTGTYNIFAGVAAGISNRKGSSNIFMGNTAGFADTTGNWNIFMGEGAGYSNLGSNNLMFGYQAGYSSTVGNYNLFMGSQAGNHNTGDNNLFLGYQTGWTNTSGFNNVFLGPLSGGYNSTGSNNVYIGNQAGYLSTTGGQNIGIGSQSGYSTTTGVSNIFLGYQAGFNNTTGMQNIFEGTQAGVNNKTGYNNIFIGVGAGQSNTDGYNNVFLGMQTGNRNTTGNFNTSLGYLAGFSNLTGSSNVFIGYQAGYNETGSNKLYIENYPGDFTTSLIYGDFSAAYLRLNASVDIKNSINFPNQGAVIYEGGKEALWFNGTYYSWGFGGTYNYFAKPVTIGNTANPAYMLYVQGITYSSGGYASSDIRWKKDLQPLNNIIPDILQLSGYRFNWRRDEFPAMNFDESKQIGLIAQDVEKVFPELVKTDKNGYKAVSYEKLSVLLLEGIKEQEKKIESAKQENDELRSEMESLKEEVLQIKAQISVNVNK